MRVSRIFTLLLLALLFFQLTSVTPLEGTAQTGPELKSSTLVVETFVTELSQPTAIAFLDPDDLLILQKNNGHIRWVKDGILQESPVLDVAVNYRSERGLLGVALDPEFPTNSYVYLYYTESSTGNDINTVNSLFGNRVNRYSWNGNTLSDATLILDLPGLPGPNHDGGIILFGPDGKLYVVIGDLNRNGQLQKLRI